MIKAILIDVGGVILSEDELYRTYLESVKEMLTLSHVVFTEEAFNKAVEQCILSFEPHFTESLVWRLVKPDRKKCDHIVNAIRGYVRNRMSTLPQTLTPGIEKVLESLSRDYKLALAGNQPSTIKEVLEKYGVLKFFTATEVSEDIGISKPDPKFFENILKKLDLEAHEVIMVGDRFDNDIIPAKKLGMKTILVKVGVYAILEPRAPDEAPDATVKSVKELPSAVASLSK